MKLAKYIGKKPRVKVGLRICTQGQTVGDPGSDGVADIVGCPGVVSFLLEQRDFVPVQIEDPTDETNGGDSDG